MNLAQFCYTIVSSVCFHDCILGMASVSAGLWSSKDGCFCGDMLVRGESWMLPMRACFWHAHHAIRGRVMRCQAQTLLGVCSALRG